MKNDIVNALLAHSESIVDFDNTYGEHELNLTDECLNDVIGAILKHEEHWLFVSDSIDGDDDFCKALYQAAMSGEILDAAKAIGIAKGFFYKRARYEVSQVEDDFWAIYDMRVTA